MGFAARAQFVGAGALILGATVLWVRISGISLAHRVSVERLEHELQWVAAKNTELSAERAELQATGKIVAMPATGSATPAGSRELRMDALLGIANLFSQEFGGAPSALLMRSMIGVGPFSYENRAAFIVDREGRMAPRFGELFGLEEIQAVSLQHSLDGLRQRIADAIASGTSYLELQPDKAVLASRALPDAQSYHDELLSILRGTLGEPGATALAKLNGVGDVLGARFSPGLGEFLHFFGYDDRMATINKTEAGYTYFLRSSWPGWNTREEMAKTIDEIRWRFIPARKLLPAGF
jgi:hypothetical protein